MSSLSKSLRSSSSLKEEFMLTKKQGIVSILGSESDCERTKSASLKRTLSADMSSKKWQSQHGFSPRKKIASSEEFPLSITDSSTSEGDEEYEGGDKETEPRGEFDIWSSIQEEKKKAVENSGQFDIWSSIISQKEQENSKNLPRPYVHPLVKRSASSLSEKSLEICTESLGSETGSDGFSSYPPSETGDEEDKEEEQEAHQQQERVAQRYDMEDLRVAKYNPAAASKKSPPGSFPPPIPSLFNRDGGSLHMKSRRDSGRLVLEAVSVPSQNNFRAQRQDGRLVLTFVNNHKEEEGPKKEEMIEEKNEMEQFEVEIENKEYEREGGEEEEEEAETEEEDVEDCEYEGGGGVEVEFVVEQPPKMATGLISVHRLALMMNRPIARNATWPSKVQFEEDKADEEIVEPITPLTQSLPTRPPVARMIPSPPTAVTPTAKAAASFNAYEYYWKPKPMGVATSVLNPITQNPSSIRSNNNNKLMISKNFKANEQQELLVLRGNNGDCLVPFSKSCKKPRRPLWFWEPHCIATS